MIIEEKQIGIGKVIFLEKCINWTKERFGYKFLYEYAKTLDLSYKF
jgi:hypothetical protein